MDKEYLVKNGGWLAGKWCALTTNLFANLMDMVGSTLTVFLDIFVSRLVACESSFPKTTLPFFRNCASLQVLFQFSYYRYTNENNTSG